MKISRVPLRLFFLIGTLIAVGSAARAADALSMAVDSPFALTSKPLSVQIKFGRWFPVAVTLSNSGDAVTGRVTLELTSSAANLSSDNSNRHIVAYADIDLPATSHKRVWLYSRVDSDNFDGAMVTFSGRGFRQLRLPFQLKSADIGQRITITVSDSGERLAFLSGFTDQRLADSAAIAADAASTGVPGAANVATSANSRLVRPLGAARDVSVPDRWAGLEAADAVILGDFAHGALAPEQINALEGYVAAGGTLLVPAGADWQRLSQSKLAELWPVRPEASGPATAAETNELVTRYVGDTSLSGADRLGGSAALVTRGTLAPGARKLAGLGGTALLATRKWGAGQVVWLAMDPTKPPFVGWRGQNELWVELFSLAAKPHRLEASDADGSPVPKAPAGYNSRYNYGYYGNLATQPKADATSKLETVIHNLPQLRMPPTSTIAWFLAIYVIVLVPVNYFVLRMMDKREWAWITVPIIACVFSFASYAAARHIKGTELLVRHIDIVQGTAGTPLARTDAMLWMLTPRRAYYNVSSSSETMALSDYCRSNNDDNEACQNDALLHEGDPTKSLRLEDYNVPMWEQAEFLGESAVPLGKGITVVNAGNKLTVSNGSPFALQGAVIFDGTRFYRCGANGELPRGTTVTALPVSKSASELSVATIGHIERIFASGSKGDHTAIDLANQALQSTVTPTSGASANEPLLVGWSTEAVVPLQLEDEVPRAQNVSLFVLRLPGLSLDTSPAASNVMATQVVSRQEIAATKKIKAKHISYFDCTFTNGYQAASGATIAIAVGGRNGGDDDDPDDSGPGAPPGSGPGPAPGGPPGAAGGPGAPGAPGGPASGIKEIAAGSMVHLEYRDTRSGIWRPIALKLFNLGAHQNGDLTAHGAMNAGEWQNALRQPDNVIQLRTTCAGHWDADNVIVRLSQ